MNESDIGQQEKKTRERDSGGRSGGGESENWKAKSGTERKGGRILLLSLQQLLVCNFFYEFFVGSGPLLKVFTCGLTCGQVNGFVCKLEETRRIR